MTDNDLLNAVKPSCNSVPVLNKDTLNTVSNPRMKEFVFIHDPTKGDFIKDGLSREVSKLHRMSLQVFFVVLS